WRLVIIIGDVIHRVMPSRGTGTHLRLVVSVILPVILLDHVIARQCKELITAAENITGEQVTTRLAS
ncbi:hypothetical protein A256_27698, partial [Pseudomonas syringae pv. actinidiae ICMP 19103]|uniref:hypothetical protein n=1 Tax=Pseudomonas syringae TaxID=317 RepID=UPI0003571D51